MPDIDNILNNMAREDEEKHAKETAAKLGLPYVNLVQYPFAPDVISIVPEDIANANSMVSYLRVGDEVRVATNNPKSPAIQAAIQKIAAGKKITFKLAYCSDTSIRYALAVYSFLLPSIVPRNLEVTENKERNFEKEIKTLEDLQEKINKIPTTQLLDVIFAGAIKLDASDVHFEPSEETFRVRFRIDGVLQNIASFPATTYHSILSRIKYLSQMKLDITHPQDGRFAFKVMSDDIDVRVSTLPTPYGEALGLRLLPKNRQFINLEKLGFAPDALKTINDSISKPQGMIIVTGPTGSGKSTTLYAILKKLNQPGRKIITLEDPIEYRIEGIEQVQIDSENQTTFLDALKGALRQDPDILMVGEIRDIETAKIALQAAMTGHLVLTTLHTINAPSALARLADMGVEPYLLAGTINLIIGQRLVRKIHGKCAGKGCVECHGTGFSGRMIVAEVLVPGPEVEELINKKAPLRTFEETARKLGMRTMYEDGAEKVKEGLTTLQEVTRVTQQ